MDGRPTPRSPSGWALANERFLFVGGELSSEIYPYRIGSNTLHRRHKLRLENVVSVRDLVYVPSLPWERWRKRLETDGKDLVWGAPFYTKTGIEPYVHRAGARVPSLRRVYQKYPYFTNGSSRSLRDLLSRFRYQGATAWHHYDASSAEAGGVKSLTAEEISGLEELLRFF